MESDGDFKAISLAQKPIETRTAEEVRDVTAYLASICAFFSLWPAGLQSELTRLLSVHILVRGEVVLTKGKPPENFYIILKGRVRRWGHPPSGGHTVVANTLIGGRRALRVQIRTCL